MIITVRDVRQVLGTKGKPYCVQGLRDFCASTGIDFDRAVREGVDSEVLLSLHNAMADAVVKEITHG